MRIGQAIDILIEDRTREFTFGEYRLFVHEQTGNVLVSGGGNHDNERIGVSKRWSNGDWELVQKPVTFMEAFKVFRNKGTIKVVCDGMADKSFNGSEEVDMLFHEQYIDNGKWYIQEED